MRFWRPLLLALPLLVVLAVVWSASAAAGDDYSYLPVIYKAAPTPTSEPPEEMVEFRALWVTRFDWIPNPPASQAKIDEIVANADMAGFNALFFQVRGEADAYYTPGLEPWARRISGGALGQPPNPYWDPLAYMVQKAHERGIQVHAYINIYSVWAGCTVPPAATPTHLYHLLAAAHGRTNSKLNGLQWDTNDNVPCSEYQWATPASVYGDNHYIAVANDIANRYAVDGIHLDRIRYAGSTTSCDPVSEDIYGPCFTNPGYGDWQRAQVSGTVRKLYEQVILNHPNLMFSAAVWGIHRIRPEWGWPSANEGYYDYYQDSKGWLAAGHMDAIVPMIYPNNYDDCPYDQGDGFWKFSRWQTLVADFQAESHGRWVIPGIGSRYCTFDEISRRIETARALGTAGHAIFSYGGLLSYGYFDDLAAGPYAIPAVVPDVPWH
jgi:uncharacterized lipoprotein YddW (UPF0748 family)